MTIVMERRIVITSLIKKRGRILGNEKKFTYHTLKNNQKKENKVEK